MRDGNHATLEVNQELFQPSNGVQVKVIGGLIQQQHIGMGDQGLSQCDTFAIAARQGGHLGTWV